MKIVFFGTDSFAVAILEKLISDFYTPDLVITQPDKPVGRKQVITPPPVKEVCQHHQIRFLQPEKVEAIKNQLSEEKPDLYIVASYGKIIPKEILDIPRLGALNVHPSLLPKYRGASPIQTAILNGEKKTGVTFMLMDEKMDHGDIIFQIKERLQEDETYRTLHSHLAHVSAQTLAMILPDFINGKFKERPQDHDQATFTKILSKEDAKIDWLATCESIERMVRAYFDWPIAWTVLPDGKRMKILKAHAHQTKPTGKPGQLEITKQSAAIACSDGMLELDLVQVEGSKEIDENAFIAGYQRLDGQVCE